MTKDKDDDDKKQEEQSSGNNNNKRRFEADDFGYGFAATTAQADDDGDNNEIDEIKTSESIPLVSSSTKSSNKSNNQKRSSGGSGFFRPLLDSLSLSPPSRKSSVTTTKNNEEGTEVATSGYKLYEERKGSTDDKSKADQKDSDKTAAAAAGASSSFKDANKTKDDDKDNEKTAIEKNDGPSSTPETDPKDKDVAADDGATPKKTSDGGDGKNSDEDKPYTYRPPKRYRGGESYVVGSRGGDYDDDLPNGGATTINGLQFMGTLCCCLTIIYVICGGIIFAYGRFVAADENNNAEGGNDDGSTTSSSSYIFVGSIFIVLAVSACLCGCCSLCVGGMTSSGGSSSSSSSLFRGGGSSSGDPDHKEVKIRMRRLNDRYEKGCLKAQRVLQETRLDYVSDMKEVREANKKQVKAKEEDDKKIKDELEKHVKTDLEQGLKISEIRQKYRRVAFYIEFDGDMMVSQLELLRKQVALVVNLAKPGKDICVVSITSPGGAVSQYGLAASQLIRIRKAGIKLIVCIDSIAASGGYMMASVGSKIIAAPFAIVGSIGVVTQIPNFQRFLEHHKVDAYLMTAGDYKRTIDMIGEVTEEGKAKLKEQLTDIHVAFKDHITLARPSLLDNIEEVATGEHWLAVEAKSKGLVDEIMTSDEYLESLADEYDIIELLQKFERPPNNVAKLLGASLSEAIMTAIKSWILQGGGSVRNNIINPSNNNYHGGFGTLDPSSISPLMLAGAGATTAESIAPRSANSMAIV